MELAFLLFTYLFIYFYLFIYLFSTEGFGGEEQRLNIQCHCIQLCSKASVTVSRTKTRTPVSPCTVEWKCRQAGLALAKGNSLSDCTEDNYQGWRCHVAFECEFFFTTKYWFQLPNCNTWTWGSGWPVLGLHAPVRGNVPATWLILWHEMRLMHTRCTAQQ